MDIELPLGFSMALAQNERAMERFAAMNPSEKQMVVAHTKNISSRREMRNYVASLAEPQV